MSVMGCHIAEDTMSQGYRGGWALHGSNRCFDSRPICETAERVKDAGLMSYVVCCVLYVYRVCPVSQVLVLDADVQTELIARLLHLLGVADGRATNTSAAYAAHHMHHPQGRMQHAN